MDESSGNKVRRFRWWWVPLGLIAAFLVVYIGPYLFYMIRYWGMPIAARTSGFAPDCLWSAQTNAWIDSNANGIQEPEEPPLPGVTFYVDDVLNGYEKVNLKPAPTNWVGETGVAVWLPGCPNARFTIYPEVPEGYQLTTTDIPKVSARADSRTFAFGFTYQPGIPTATPRPPEPNCSSYPDVGKFNRYDLVDVAVAPDDTVWFATYGNGVTQYIPDTGQWITYHVRDGLASDQVRTITPAPNGGIWFGTEGGASFYDGQGWTTYTTDDGLFDIAVREIYIDSLEQVWFGSFEGIAKFVPQTGEWHSKSLSNFIWGMGGTSSGEIWLSIDAYPSGISTYSIDSFQAYRVTTSPDMSHFHEVAEDAQGRLWFISWDGLFCYNPQSDEWARYTQASGEDLAIGLDGSIFIASGYREPVLYRFFPDMDNEAEAWRVYDQRQGIYKSPTEKRNDGIKGIAIAADGSVWMVTRDAAVHCEFYD